MGEFETMLDQYHRSHSAGSSGSGVSASSPHVEEPVTAADAVAEDTQQTPAQAPEAAVEAQASTEMVSEGAPVTTTDLSRIRFDAASRAGEPQETAPYHRAGTGAEDSDIEGPPVKPTPFSFHEKTPGAGASKSLGFVQVRSVPIELVELLYDTLSRAAGTPITRAQVPLQSVITAALMALLGAQQPVDATTGWALDRLRDEDLRLHAIETHIAEGFSDVSMLADSVKQLATKMGEFARSSGVMEMMLSYVLADRVGVMPREPETFSTYTLTRPEVLTTRERATEQALNQLRAEERAKGRSRP